ncbi:Shugoshin [Macrophomina phaseolina MS6]|uniref:Shugoshin n=1 Tax=Macrophomina phaseolina (strain MS6) TaxID=1126212 RepID=K2S3M1_MACPH|nr:Shugoshin [Macrophomina phaseolina MS6]
MARLNEAPPPQESVDQLKRRFIRQNRELAKNNSAQSVRIRALETEQARLLAENLSLREQVIQLQTELEHTRGHAAVEQISSVKDQLESKLMEIGSLVAELNSIKKPTYKKRASDAGPSKAMEQFEWRRAMREQAGEHDDDEILPTITEDKYYPRRTLDVDELRTVLTDATDDSPDLGPPPVVHFPDEDPIKFDPKQAMEDENDDMDVDQKEEEELLPPNISVNLETRKKRRDSSKLDLRKMSVFQSPEEEDAAKRGDLEESQPSKMGRKRKLSATAEDTNGDSNEKDYRDDFRFSRRGGDRENRQPFETSHKKNAKLDMLLNTERKALGDKTNTSPKKVQKSDSKSEAKKPETSKEAARNRVRERKARAAMVQMTPSETNEVVERADIPTEEVQQPEQQELPPKTPAGLDLFSPVSTEPSAARQESRDTPPPGDLGAGTSEAAAGGRPSRRARSQVNYAEPNLISKMRRPTEKKVDAVVDGRRSSDAQVEQGKPAPSSTNAMRTVVIKRERQDDANLAWKASSEQPEPHSPLSSKTAALQLGAGPEPQEPEVKEPKQVEDRPSKSATAVKDFLPSSTCGASRSRKSAAKHSSSSAATDPTAPAIERNDRQERPELAIFEFNVTDGSSPSDDKDSSAPSSADSNAEQIMKSSRALAAKTSAFSSSRRHSSAVSSTSKDREGGAERTSATKSVSFGDEATTSRSKASSKQVKGSSSSSSTAEGRTAPERSSSTRRRSMMV